MYIFCNGVCEFLHTSKNVSRPWYCSCTFINVFMIQKNYPHQIIVSWKIFFDWISYLRVSAMSTPTWYKYSDYATECANFYMHLNCFPDSYIVSVFVFMFLWFKKIINTCYGSLEIYFSMNIRFSMDAKYDIILWLYDHRPHKGYNLRLSVVIWDVKYS